MCNGNWITGKISVDGLCEEQQPWPEILVVFLPEVTKLARLTVYEKLCDQFKIPVTFWSSIAHEASGFFSCQDIRDINGELKTFIKEPIKPASALNNASNVCLPYVWHRMGFYTMWTPSKSFVVLCFGLPPSLQHSLSNLGLLNLDDPFSFHTLLIEKIAALYDAALWSWRDLIRDLEKNRTPPQDPQPNYIMMHELARHTIHSSETLAMAIETIASLIQEHEIFFEENASLPLSSIILSKQTRRGFRSQVTLLKCLQLRSKALEERLRNETNLAFNTVAQHDSRIAVQIGEATQVDSAAMKTISVLGLAFLPGTFICALFSTSFFNFSPGSSTEPQHWTVSEKFWIYWVVAIPVTALTVACWASWQRSCKGPLSHSR
ncbi:hypothetical protein BDZ45DRAFT_186193 [Acephala macrosclerotiorum]|nr:hypothetical protein BDZ45DRAFT_186193 [Acephala macrosclerotiorum]